MDSKEDIQKALDEFSQKPADKIPDVLERYFKKVAVTGEPLFEWEKIKPAFRCKMNQSMKEFDDQVPSDHFLPTPNVENVKFEEMRTRLMAVLDTFNGAPFTIQRLCELITNPLNHYKRTDKFMRGIEKNMMIVSAVDPFGNKIVCESRPFINGLEANGMESDELHTPEKKDSPFLPPPPANSPAVASWFGNVSPGSSPVGMSPWLRASSGNASATSDVAGESSMRLQSPVFNEAWSEPELDDFVHGPPEKRSRLSPETAEQPTSSNSQMEAGPSSSSYTVTKRNAEDVPVAKSSQSQATESGTAMLSAMDTVTSNDQPISERDEQSRSVICSSPVTKVTSSETDGSTAEKSSESAPALSHITDSTSAAQCHSNPIGIDNVEKAEESTTSESKHLPIPSNTSINEISASVSTSQEYQSESEANKISSTDKKTEADIDENVFEEATSSEVSMDSEPISSGEAEPCIECTEQLEPVEQSGQDNEEEDTTIEDLRDSRDSQGFDMCSELEENSAPCSSPTIPSTVQPATDESSETKSDVTKDAVASLEPCVVSSTEVTSSDTIQKSESSSPQQGTSDNDKCDTTPAFVSVSSTPEVIPATEPNRSEQEPTTEPCLRLDEAGDTASELKDVASESKVTSEQSESPDTATKRETAQDVVLSSTSSALDSVMSAEHKHEHESMETN